MTCCSQNLLGVITTHKRCIIHEGTFLTSFAHPEVEDCKLFPIKRTHLSNRASTSILKHKTLPAMKLETIAHRTISRVSMTRHNVSVTSLSYHRLAKADCLNTSSSCPDYSKYIILPSHCFHTANGKPLKFSILHHRDLHHRTLVESSL